MRTLWTCIFVGELLLTSCISGTDKKYESWGVYGGTKESIRYSSLTEIDTGNVQNLKEAWVFHTGDADTAFHSQMQCNPIIIDSFLYGLTPQMKVFSLHAATGVQNWMFDPTETISIDTSLRSRLTQLFANTGRGVTYWTDGKQDKRILYAAGSKLICLNATNGKLIRTFGDNGSVDLHNGLGRNVFDLYITSNTPGIIYKDLIILGTRVSEDAYAAPGHLRAFDVRTGQQKWIFHTIPQPGEYGYDSWDDPEAWKHMGGVNSWSGLSLDEERGIVFVPTGSASFDFYGGKRIGQNLFANCVLALEAATGKRLWHFQTVHHDIWDRDLPAAPALVTLKIGAKKVDAVAQTTKSGFVFLFERTTGQPIFPIEERPVPTTTDLVGEKLWPTQPFPTLPKPFARQQMTEDELNNLVPDSSYQAIKKTFAEVESGTLFTPLSKKGTIIFPGLDGGAEWGGPAFDPATGILYVNSQESPWVITMIDAKNKTPLEETFLQAGKRIYVQNCVNCHGPHGQGGGNYPSLSGVGEKYDTSSFRTLITNGRRMMPAFNRLTDPEISALASFILGLKDQQAKKFINTKKPKDPYLELPYGITGYIKFTTQEGYPAVKPPWGTLNAINLSTGEFVWKVTLGDEPEFKAKGIHTGAENYGGPIVTAGGLVFIAATKDGMIRAFNKFTGKLLWEYRLPVPGFATPSMYKINGKQYLVIACGGGKLKTQSGDAYVAFTLP